MGAIDELLLYDRKKVESSSYYQDGKEDGRKEGLKDRSVEIAKNLLDLNVAIPIVIKSTGLSKKEIRKLQETI